MKLGDVLKILAKSKKLKQNYIAEKIGKSVTAVNQIFNNKYYPDKKTLDEISNLFGIPVHVIHFMCVTDDTIPENKKMLWKYVKPLMEKFLIELYNLDEKQVKLPEA